MPSSSKAQQKFMGMVHSLQKGDMKPSDASPEVKKAAKSMSDKDAKDFASTKHKGLPRKVKQEILNRLKEYANKMGTNTMGGDDYTSSKKGGLRDFDGYDNVDYNKNIPMDEGKLPNNWMSGRTSDYHTKLRGKEREYDDTNFEKDNSGQPDLEESQAVSGGKVHKFITGKNLKYKGKKYSDIEFELLGIDNKSKLVKLKVLSPKNLFGQEMNVPFKTIRRGPFLKTDTSNIKEGDLEDTIHQVKKFEKPKDKKLLTIKVINKLKDKRNKSKSSSNKQKLQKMIDKIEGDYKKGKFLTEFGSRLTEPYLLPKDEDKLDGTPKSKDAIDRNIDEKTINLTNLVKNFVNEGITSETNKVANEFKKELIDMQNHFGSRLKDNTIFWDGFKGVMKASERSEGFEPSRGGIIPMYLYLMSKYRADNSGKYTTLAKEIEKKGIKLDPQTSKRDGYDNWKIKIK